MDMFANELSSRQFRRPASADTVLDKIASEGGEFSRHLTGVEGLHPVFQCMSFADEVYKLNVFPEQFES